MIPLIKVRLWVNKYNTILSWMKPKKKERGSGWSQSTLIYLVSNDVLREEALLSREIFMINVYIINLWTKNFFKDSVNSIGRYVKVYITNDYRPPFFPLSLF